MEYTINLLNGQNTLNTQIVHIQTRMQTYLFLGSDQP